MLPTNQTLFSQALLDPSVALVNISKSRLDIYRNNVTVSLVNALAETFKTCSAIVGEEFFNAMALHFVRQHPPKSPILTLYGAEFSAFIRDFSPAASVGYLADIADLEYGRVVAFHCVDEVATQSALSQFALDTCITLKKSIQIIRSQYAIYNIWTSHYEEEALDPVVVDAPQNILIFRHQFSVEIIRISTVEANFFEQLQQGKSLLQACEQVMKEQLDDDALFDPLPSIKMLIKHSLIADSTTH
jgi:hypothetical protein